MLPSEFTPYKDNIRTGQLSAFDDWTSILREAEVVSWTAQCEQLNIRKWCFGEVRVSLTPRCPLTRRKDPRVQEEGLHSGFSEIIGKTPKVKNPSEKKPVLLVKRREFQDGIEVLCGYGRLPRKSMMSRYSATAVRECSEIAVRHCGNNGIVLTATLPGSFAEGFYQVACYSGYLVSLGRQWIRDNLLGRHHVFGVWEHQERGALHLHWVVMSKDVAGLEALLAKFQPYWRKLLLELSETTKTDLFAKNADWSWRDNPDYPRCDAQWLRKNPAQYLSKYCGKEACEQLASAAFCPSRWVTLDLQTLREAVEERVRLTLGGTDMFRAKRLFQDLVERASNTAACSWTYYNKIFWGHVTRVFEFSQRDLAEFVTFSRCALRFALQPD